MSRYRGLLALLFLSTLLAQRARAIDPPKKEVVAPSAKVEAVKRDLSVALAKLFPKSHIDSRSEPGPVGLTVVTAAVENAGPGSGVFRVLVDQDGVTYGVHGEKDFAELVRARKWLDGAVPDDATLVRLVDLAFFDGVAILMNKPAPSSALGGDALNITLYRTWHPSGGKTRVQVTVGSSGKAQVESFNEKLRGLARLAAASARGSRPSRCRIKQDDEGPTHVARRSAPLDRRDGGAGR